MSVSLSRSNTYAIKTRKKKRRSRLVWWIHRNVSDCIKIQFFKKVKFFARKTFFLNLKSEFYSFIYRLWRDWSETTELSEKVQPTSILWALNVLVSRYYETFSFKKKKLFHFMPCTNLANLKVGRVWKFVEHHNSNLPDFHVHMFAEKYLNW